jgi:hypothetical protein
MYYTIHVYTYETGFVLHIEHCLHDPAFRDTVCGDGECSADFIQF